VTGINLCSRNLEPLNLSDDTPSTTVADFVITGPGKAKSCAARGPRASVQTHRTQFPSRNSVVPRATFQNATSYGASISITLNPANWHQLGLPGQRCTLVSQYRSAVCYLKFLAWGPSRPSTLQLRGKLQTSIWQDGQLPTFQRRVCWHAVVAHMIPVYYPIAAVRRGYK
jgi:hypothetical protein